MDRLEVGLDPDLFDLQPFTPAEILNRLLPGPDDLSKIDALDEAITEKLRVTDSELRASLQNHSPHGSPGANPLDAAKRNIRGLVARAETLLTKAMRSEREVQLITGGITGLDLAKRNLTAAITFSRRLQMLVTAVEQLRVAIDRRDYAAAGPLSQAVAELFVHFQGFRNLRPIFELRSDISSLQASLLGAVMDEVKSGFDAQAQVVGAVPRLALACAAVDGHPDGRRQVTAHFLELVSQAYSNSFPPGEEVSDLANLPQRFAWLKRFIGTYDAGASRVFPEHWGVACKSAQAVCEATAHALTHLLEGEGDVNLMVRTLQIALAFEGQLDKKFPASPSGCGPLPFAGMLCCCFEPHLQRYLDRESSLLQTKLGEFAAMPPTADPELAVRVLSSSTALLLMYQESLATLCKVTRGKFLLSLARLFFKGLEDYASQLLQLLAREEKRLLSDEELDSACLVINTAHYCHGAAGQLASRVEGLLDSSFRQQLDCVATQEALLNTALVSTRRLVRGCEGRFDAGFSQLSKLGWATWRLTTTPEYAHTLMAALDEVLTKLTIHYPVAHRAFCDRLAEAFIAKWADTIAKLHRLPPAAAQQLAEDGEKILPQLCRLSVAGDPAREPPMTFQRMVRKQYLSRIRSYLDLLRLDLSPPYERFFEKFFAFASPPHFPVFLRLMEVRGIKRVDQGPLREALQERIRPLSPNGPHNRVSLPTEPIASPQPSLPHASPPKANGLSFAPQRLQANLRRFVGLGSRPDPSPSASVAPDPN